MTPSLSFHKTRIAPTPSGFLHLGNILSFALTATLAERTGATTLLRIDDLDRERALPLYVMDIFDTLSYLDIPWQEGPRHTDAFEKEYSQLRRMGLYEQALQQLADKGAVYACTCSRTQLSRHQQQGTTGCACKEKELPLDTPNSSWRLTTDTSTILRVKKIDGHFTEATLPDSMQDFVVKKKDGFPAYQLTSVVDDVHYGVDLIVRGADLWDSTLAQQYLSMKLGQPAFTEATFLHHALLLEADGQKLSKSAGATSIQYLRETAHSPAAIYALAATLAGIHGSVHDWRSLGAAMMANNILLSHIA